jgi:hypothetical protein
MGRVIDWVKKRIGWWWTEFKSNKKLFGISFLLLVLSAMIHYYAGKYVQTAGVSIVKDIFLDNIPPVDLTFIFVWVWLAIVVLLFMYPLFLKPRAISDTISHFSLLIITRSFFIMLTHLKNPLDAIPISFPGLLNKMAFENDLFFSGHTAVPFLGFLLFKGSPIRYVFLALSILMGITVLLMHHHYTIDVLAAYFITYGIFKIGKFVFTPLEKTKI